MILGALAVIQGIAASGGMQVAVWAGAGAAVGKAFAWLIPML